MVLVGVLPEIPLEITGSLFVRTVRMGCAYVFHMILTRILLEYPQGIPLRFSPGIPLRVSPGIFLSISTEMPLEISSLIFH